MEYKKNKKTFSLAFKKEIALKAVFIEVQINYSSTTCSKNGALVQNGLNIYGGIVAKELLKKFQHLETNDLRKKNKTLLHK